MLLNADLTIRTAIHAGRQNWVASPAKGVERRMLFRIGEEKARATSIVRYAAQSRFPWHMHPGGEEFMVLEGVFQDEGGDYPAGSYVRNPPGTRHTPASEAGCVIFVKLWQFRQDDLERVIYLPGKDDAQQKGVNKATSIGLFNNTHEHVALKYWPPESPFQIENPEGLELLIVSGSFTDGQETFEPLSWLRLPPGMNLNAHAESGGCQVWMKAGPSLPDNICEF
ncbi:cupin [Candidimonas sp. SYP-B2681]|nr:cupin [Candidimonas sp. SYP-B2681]